MVALMINLIGGTSSAHSFNPEMRTSVTRGLILIFKIYDLSYTIFIPSLFPLFNVFVSVIHTIL